MDCIATFDTTHMAILFEKTCRNAGFSCKIVPVPRSISASCGLACRFRVEDETMIRQLAMEHSIEVLEYHPPDPGI
ncbi:MAG: DUF3343 domain-containing protein [Thermovirgaceae bacterium]|jgi:hypothetical protein|nr:DUF3343 domain-containing protein [Synergistales bacterium]MDI9392731.1 DUF3343 domain-containing protein [Synergistota bacterium]MDY0178666.1 DUF3343 domain-containing protein [Synergistaceae bacterium]HRW87836.1 DUF3343 domain-containing protein [Thermovirgaceae bacterium]MDD3133410.1 DUF3343 domain-containing protein [Synergistales bacterium]